MAALVLLLAGAPDAAGSRTTGRAPSSSAAASAPAAVLDSLLHTPQPQLYFNVVYCGSGRLEDTTSRLHDLDWNVAARAFGLTILLRNTAGYGKFARRVRVLAPAHTLIVYQHAHGLFQYDDRPGALNLVEDNYLHATDPASLRVIQVPAGLLVDWMPDERVAYDEYQVASPARQFRLRGYVVLRRERGGDFAQLASLPRSATSFADSTAVPGVTYGYRVETVYHLGHHLRFSNEVEAVRETPPPPPPSPAAAAAAAAVIRDLERTVGAAHGAPSYPLTVRMRAGGPTMEARLLVDQNADRDFEDPGETVPMVLVGEGRYEASTALDAASRTAQDLNRTIGFAYRLELDTPDGTVTLPATGSFTTSINNRVRSRRYGFYIMRVDRPEWVDHQKRRIRRRLGRSRDVTGLFLDELFVDLRFAADADPIDMTTDGFHRAAAEFTRQLRSTYPGLELYFNGAGLGVDAPETAGGMIEGFCVARWLRGGSAPFFGPPSIWEQQMRSALEIARRGRDLLLLARDAPFADHRARIYALASFHIVRGAGSRFCYLPENCAARPLPEWQVDLGPPIETFTDLSSSAASAASASSASSSASASAASAASASSSAAPGEVGGGLYRRRFERSEVWVNADRYRTRRVELGRPGVLIELTADGDDVVAGRRVQSFELGPQSGAIVLRAAVR